jgi:hypothetical protein
MTITVRISSSFGGKVKSSAPCRKILWHVKEPCRVKEIGTSVRNLSFSAIGKNTRASLKTVTNFAYTVKIPYFTLLLGKIHGHFSHSFSCFSTRLLPESSGGWIRNDYNSRWGSCIESMKNAVGTCGRLKVSAVHSHAARLYEMLLTAVRRLRKPCAVTECRMPCGQHNVQANSPRHVEEGKSGRIFWTRQM